MPHHNQHQTGQPHLGCGRQVHSDAIQKGLVRVKNLLDGVSSDEAGDFPGQSARYSRVRSSLARPGHVSIGSIPWVHHAAVLLDRILHVECIPANLHNVKGRRV